MPTIVVPCTNVPCRNWLKVPAPYHGGEALCALCRDKEKRKAVDREGYARRAAHEKMMRRLRGEE